MKKPIQVQWLEYKMLLNREELKQWKIHLKESRNPAMAHEIRDRISRIENDLKMQKVIHTQITNYKALKSA